MKSLSIFFLILLAASNTVSAQTPSYVWAKSMGGSVADRPESIAVDRLGNVLSIGNFGDTADFDPGPRVANLVVPVAGQIPPRGVGRGMFFSRLDSGGNYVWVKQIGNPTSGAAGMPHDVAVDAAGRLLGRSCSNSKDSYRIDLSNYPVGISLVRRT